MYRLFYGVSQLLRLLSLAILVHAVMSWVYPRGKLFDFLSRLTAPILAPFRRLSYWVMNRTGLPVDFSPWFAMIAINFVSELIWRAYFMLPWGLR